MALVTSSTSVLPKTDVESVCHQIATSKGLTLFEKIKEIFIYAMTCLVSSKKVTYLNNAVKQSLVTKESAISSIGKDKIFEYFDKVSFKNVSSLLSREEILKHYLSDDEKFTQLGSSAYETYPMSTSEFLKEIAHNKLLSLYSFLTTTETFIEGFMPSISNYSLINRLNIPQKADQMNTEYFIDFAKRFLESKKYEKLSDEEFEKLLNTIHFNWDAFEYNSLNPMQKKVFDKTKELFGENFAKILVQALPDSIKTFEIETDSEDSWTIKLEFEKENYSTKMTQTGPKLDRALKFVFNRMIKNKNIPLNITPIRIKAQKKENKVHFSLIEGTLTIDGEHIKELTLNTKKEKLLIKCFSINLKDILQVSPVIKWD